MILRLLSLILLGTGAAQAQGQIIRPVELGSQVEWRADREPSRVVYRFADVSVTVERVPDPETPELVGPRLTVEAPGLSPVQLQGVMTGTQYEHQVGVGRFDGDGRRFLYLESYTGGAHCCNDVQVAIIPASGAIAVLSLGTWDGGSSGELPSDEDGDGLVDFIQRDDRFLYAFSSYAGSFAPPQILNIVEGAVVDVSTRPSFRRFFVEAMEDARAACREGSERNGGCAGYVAAAARAGRLKKAWSEMLRHYERSSRWGLDDACRVAAIGGDCPADQRVSFNNYPDALRYYLSEWGYLPGA